MAGVFISSRHLTSRILSSVVHNSKSSERKKASGLNALGLSSYLSSQHWQTSKPSSSHLTILPYPPNITEHGLPRPPHPHLHPMRNRPKPLPSKSRRANSRYEPSPLPNIKHTISQPTGFIFSVCAAVICWPSALLCGCCASETGKK